MGRRENATSQNPSRSQLVVTVEAFAEEVDRYFRETYQLGAEYM
jgi:hypothetical protein